jgi:DMSO/TMAO reductase YedYZ heme-binding membrane subunit
MMSAIWFTIVAVILYLVSDWILERIEVSLGKRLDHRSLIFFVILLTLAVTTFAVIQRSTGNS